MILIGVKSKYGSCNGSCTGFIIFKSFILFCISCKSKPFITSFAGLLYFGSIPKKDLFLIRFFYLFFMTFYIFSEIFSGFFSQFLDVLSIISIFFGIFIIVSKNPIVSVLFLIMLFSTISVYLILIGAKFIGISYLLVYVGAVSILFLFILMLINIRVSELISDTNNNIPLAILTILAFINPINNILPDQIVRSDSFLDILFKGEINKFSDYLKSNSQISYVSSKNWDNNIYDSIDIVTIGNILYTSYSIWLIITSVILLLAMVGAIVITIKQKDV